MQRPSRTAGRAATAAALLASLVLFGVRPAAAGPATTPRYAHVSALMVDGRTFVAGGLDATNTPLNTAEILDTLHGSVFIAPTQNSFATSMSVARASATITVLPNGNILVAGGWDGTCSRKDGEVYNPNTNLWTTVGTGGACAAMAGMQNGRQNHTATLLNTGSVLICGGYDTAAAGVAATCDLFTPTNGTTCLAAGGCFTTTGGLLLGRALHTSTLLGDGTVWIAGGWNQTLPSGGWVVTTERYNPGAGAWQQAQPLNSARGYHTATLTGDNKVLVVGGFNGVNRKDPAGFFTSMGILQTSEIFDPTGGSIIPGPPMQSRIQKHAAVLQADGEVAIYGGLGNIGTNQLLLTVTPVTLSPSAYVSGAVSTGIQNGYTNSPSTSGAGSIGINFFINPPVTGQIIDGEVDFTSASVTLNGAYADFVTADENNPAVGLRASLQGVTVDCDPVSGVCGRVQTTFPLALQNMGQGGYHITAPKDQPQLLPASSVNGSLTFQNSSGGSCVNFANGLGSITSGNFTAHLQLAVSPLVSGWNISNVNCGLTVNDTVSWSQASTYTVVLNGGSGSAAGPFPTQKSGGTVFIDIPSFTFNGVTGSISYSGVNGNAPVCSVLAVSNASLTALTCSMDYTSSGLNIGGGTLKFTSFYALIRNMVSSDYEFFAPTKNQWSFAPTSLNGTGGILRPSVIAEGASAVHMPNDDIFTIGGRQCAGGCTSLAAASSGGGRQDSGLLNDYQSFAKGAVADVPHAYHSANLLSDGTILLAGGTDGSYVLPSAEIFDPVAKAFTPTNSLMHTGRQQHSANLLPNGRVLFAGGFATTAASTGPTNTAEIYYPDTKVFLNTSLMISSHSQHAAVGLPGGNVFVAGGYNNQASVTNVAEVFYATASAWRQVANMPNSRAIAPAVQLNNGRVLVCGGTNNTGILSSCDIYDPVTNLWNVPVAPPAMPGPLQGHTMTLMADGRALVAGGNDGFGETTSSYLYDPVGNAWAVMHALVSGRFGHDATLLPNGSVMISGGVQQVAPLPGSPANALQTVEYYHPFPAQWSDSSGTLKFNIGPRSFHTATLAADGNIYFFGGANGSIGTGQSNSFYTKYESDYFTAPPDFDARLQTSVRQSTITSTTASPFLPGTTFTATGLRFRGGTEGSGGAGGTENSSFNYPRLMLQKIDGGGGAAAESSPGFIDDLTTQIPANAANLTTLDTNLQVALPATNAGLPYGWYMTWVGNNDVHAIQAPLVQVGPAKPASAVTNLVGTTLGVSSITYTWTGIGGIDGYEVFSATSGVFLATVPVASPQFTQTNLLPNTTAGLIVAGYTLSGDGPAANSATTYTLASVPQNVTIASVTFNTLLLQWNTNLNLPGAIYEVGESSDNFVTSFSTPVPSILGQTQNFVTITQLQPNTTYFFRVRAYNTAGLSSAWSVSASTLTRTSVSGVAGVALNPPGSIQWSWNPAGAVINYKVYNSTSGQLLAAPVSNSFLDTGLAVNAPRSIQVSAVTPAGEGPLTPPTTVYTMAAQPGFVSPALSGLTTGSFTIQWSPNGNPNGTVYDINMAAKVSSVTVVTTSTTGGFFFSYGGLQPSSLYQVAVYATNGDGILSIPYVIGSTYTLATAPTLLKIDGTTPVSLSADWSQNGNSTTTFYQVTYSTDNFVANISTAIPFSNQYNGSTVTINGLLTSTTYWLRVVAENIYGQQTAFSNVVATVTFNGGAPIGSLAGVIAAQGTSEFSGNLVNGRFVDVRSPGGSFPVNTTVTVSSYNVTGTLCPNGLNVAFSLTDSPALQPNIPIYFTSSYSPSDVGAIPVAQIALERYEPVSGACVPLQTSFDTANLRFTSQLNHFSIYQLAQIPLATDAGSARLFPNPYRAATDAYVTIDRVPPASRVRVMTLRGETVMDAAANGAGLLTWNATNGAGRSVASGLYLVVIESGGSKNIVKLAVIR